MRHTDTMQANPALSPSTVTDSTTGRLIPCNGQLTHVESWPDRRITTSGILECVVSEYRCRMCNHRIVLERRVVGTEAVAIDYTVANDYLPVEPRQMVRNLAGRMDVPGWK